MSTISPLGFMVVRTTLVLGGGGGVTAPVMVIEAESVNEFPFVCTVSVY